MVSCMIWLLKPDHPKATEFAPAMEEGTGVLPGFPAVAGKPVHVAFDGGRLTSDAGILLLAALEQRLRIGSDRRRDGADVSAGVEVAAAGREVVVLDRLDKGPADACGLGDLFDGQSRVLAGRREGLADGHRATPP